MSEERPSVEGMTWWAFVQSTAGGIPHAHIASSVGITPPSVSRWKSGSRPDPAQAAAFARAYDKPVLEAFIAAGFLTPEEANQKPSAPPSLASLGDEELIREVLRRMQGGTDDRQPPAQKRAEDEAPASIEDLRRRRSAPPSGVFDIAAAGHDDRRERDHEDNEDDEPS